MTGRLARVLFAGAWCLALAGCTREKGTYVAEVLDKKITAQEFADRYKKYLAAMGGRDNILLRKQILNNMVNEQLILDDVSRQKFDQDTLSVKRMNELRTQAILLGYAKRITLDTMAITEDDLKNEFVSYGTKVHARYVYAPTEDSAWSLRERLEHGETFDRMARTVFQDPGLANNGGDLGYFGWGEMEQPLEELAFSAPIGSLSEPVKLRLGYAIVKVEERIRQPLSSESDYAKVREKLAGAIQKRRVVDILQQATLRIRNTLSPTFNEAAVSRLFNDWRYLTTDTLSTGFSEATRENIASMPLVSFRDRSLTIGDFLKQIQSTTARQRKRVKSVEEAKEFIVGLAVREENLQRAIASGVEKDSAVQDDIGRQRMEFLLKRWRGSVEDTVGEHGWDNMALQRLYGEKNGEYLFPPEINVGEILVHTQDEAKSIMNQLRRGAKFDELARKYSLRLWAAKQGGALGFGPKSMYGVLADTLFGADVGSFLGPFHVDPYFGVFMILGKHAGRKKTFDEAREDVVKEISFEKKQRVTREAIERLRASTKVFIDEEVLANIIIN